MKDILYVVMVADNMHKLEDHHILTATVNKDQAYFYMALFEKQNPQGACSIIKFQDGLRLAEVL